MTTHDQLRSEMAHDLRSHRARQRERRKRTPIIAKMNQIRAELGLPPINPEGA